MRISLFKNLLEDILSFIKTRTFILGVVYTILLAVLIHRLFQLQIINGEDYLNTFTYPIQKGKKMTVAITGNNHAVKLYLDGKLVETLDKQVRYYNEGKSKMFYLPTLVFPLEKAGNFKSRVTNLKVYQE